MSDAEGRGMGREATPLDFGQATGMGLARHRHRVYGQIDTTTL